MGLRWVFRLLFVAVTGWTAADIARADGSRSPAGGFTLRPPPGEATPAIHAIAAGLAQGRDRIAAFFGQRVTTT